MSSPAPTPRCHLCRRNDGLVRDRHDPSRWWCSDLPGCNYQARRRLHMRKEDAEALLAEERWGRAVRDAHEEGSRATEIATALRLPLSVVRGLLARASA